MVEFCIDLLEKSIIIGLVDYFFKEELSYSRGEIDFNVET